MDPQRDAWRFLEVAERRGWRVRHVLETHVHNDYLSGALETRAATGAEVVAPARGRYEFEHMAVDEGDELELGGLRLTAWATPGHTPEHLAWVVQPRRSARAGRRRPLAVFTGGSLLVGSSGRTDLLGPALTDALTRDQQRSLRRLAELPDATQVLPTHGAGSFCSAGPGERESRLHHRRGALREPGLRARRRRAGGVPSAGPRRARALPGLLRATWPRINRRGPRVLGRLILPPALDPGGVRAGGGRGARRSSTRAIARRSPRATSRARSTSSSTARSRATSAGSCPSPRPCCFVLPAGAPDALATATTELLRIGYERVPRLARGRRRGLGGVWQAARELRDDGDARPCHGARRGRGRRRPPRRPPARSSGRTASYRARSRSSSPTCPRASTSCRQGPP